MTGNLFATIDRLVLEKREYNLIICNNVLEHVVDPFALLQKIRKILSVDGICRIVVPNDDSILQRDVVEREFADPEFWVSVPEHLNYFNVDSFLKILDAAEFRIIEMLCDFPVDVFLYNPDSNYKKNPLKGKKCHLARVMFENLLGSINIENLINFRKGCAQAKVGRDIIAYCGKR